MKMFLRNKIFREVLYKLISQQQRPKRKQFSHLTPGTGINAYEILVGQRNGVVFRSLQCT